MNTVPPFDDDVARVDLLVAGLGPGGCAAALAARGRGLDTLAVEARGPEATRAQLILVRPGAQAALQQLGFADITDGRRTTTIRHVENRLRAALAEPPRTGRATAPFAHRWHTSVVGLELRSGHVHATLRDEASGQLRQVQARHLVDATGGRLEALGRPARARIGPQHWVITAEYAAPPWFDGIVGMHFRGTRDLYLLFPTWGRRGVIAYLDSLPGTDGSGLAERFESIAALLGLGAPLYPSSPVDVVQRSLPQACGDRIVPIGDSVGTVDVLSGAGMSAAIEDAVQAVHAVADAQRSGEGAREAALTSAASAQVFGRHRRALRLSRTILAARPLLERVWPSASLPAVDRQSLGPPPLLWPMIRFVFGKRPATAR